MSHWDTFMRLYEIGKVVRARRLTLGLTQQGLARFAGLPYHTLLGLEDGTIDDLSFVCLVNLLAIVGLRFPMPSMGARNKKHGLWMAAKNASVSYKGELTSYQLQQTLTTGRVAAGHESYILHFLGETPLPMMVMAVEETATLCAISPGQIWTNIARLAAQLGSERKSILAEAVQF